MRVAVVMPVFNEARTVREAIERVLRTPPPMRDGEAVDRFIVVVDDGSTDGSGEIVREMADGEGVVAMSHERNRGKGAALGTGFREALSRGAEVVIVQDADLEYTPADHAAVLAPILDGRADAVIGSRFLGQTHRVLYYWHSVANRGITLLSNMLTNLNLSDIECCFKAMTREVAERIRIEERRFGVEPEIVAKLARLRLGEGRRLRIYEVPVNYAGRTYEEGKKIGWKDGVSAVRCIVRYNLL